MSIPQLNDGLLPAGVHRATIEDLERRFGFSAKRRDLIEQGLKPILQELIKMGIRELYIGGSFTTSKPSPGDVDAYVKTSLESPFYEPLVARQEIWREQFRVQIQLAVEESEDEEEGSFVYWREFFGQTKEMPSRARGIVELHLRGEPHVHDQER